MDAPQQVQDEAQGPKALLSHHGHQHQKDRYSTTPPPGDDYLGYLVCLGYINFGEVEKMEKN